VDNLKIPISGIELYVLELKESDHNLRPMTGAIPKEPVNFQFHFHW